MNKKTKILNFFLWVIFLTNSCAIYANTNQDNFSDNDLRKLFIISGDSGISPGNHYGGMVLFKHNLKHKTGCQIKKENPQTTLFIDQEGGDVIRLEKYPLIAPIHASNLSIKDYYKMSEVVAKGLVESCIDANLAPVIELNNSNSRSYGENKQKVYEYASAFISAMKKEGVATVLKHFPGEANDCKSVTNLQHLGLNLKKNTEVYECNIKDMNKFKNNVKLFKEINSDSVMIGQGIYTNFSTYPALLEPLMRKWLVDDLKYNNVIISDALWEIEATPKAIIMALKTVDWVMVGTPNSVENALPLLKKAIQTGIFSNQEIQNKLDLIKKFKNKNKNRD